MPGLLDVADGLRADGRAIADALALAERRFQATFLHAPVGIAHVSLDGGFLMVNPRFAEITGYTGEQLLRIDFQQITHADDLGKDEALLARLHAGEIARYAMEKRYLRQDGSEVWVNLTVAMVRDAVGAPEFFLAVVEDLSEIRQASFDAIHDSLTGLLNRRGFAKHGGRILGRAIQEGQRIGLLYLDLDGFKGLNDRRGHAVGDVCLADLARLLEAHMRPHDAIGRMGGDEFVAIFTGVDVDSAARLAERIRGALGCMPSVAGEGVSGSFGLVSLMPDADTALDTLIAQADAAMLRAKRGGKNQMVVSAG
jgi:diguanylate cyclase (GGDEF)-like protein/PAS domain S-box-containing protein